MPIKIKDPNVGTFDMPWEDTSRSPTTQEIDDYIAKNVSGKTEAPGRSLWDKANTPIAPEVPRIDTRPKSVEDAKFKTDHPIRSFLGDAVSEISNDAYDKLVRPLTSPLALGTAAATLGVAGTGSNLLRQGARLGLAALAGKQTADTVEKAKEAYKNPTAENVADTVLGVSGATLTGLGALKLGQPKISAPEPSGAVPEAGVKVQNVDSGIETNNSVPRVVTVPKGVSIKVRPGYEDILDADPETQRVIIKDPTKFKDALSDVKGDPKDLKKLAKDLKEAIPSTDYNEGYNPDAIVDSQVKGPKDVKTSFADWVNARSAAKWTGENVKRAWSALDDKYNSENPAEIRPTEAPTHQDLRDRVFKEAGIPSEYSDKFTPEDSDIVYQKLLGHPVDEAEYKATLQKYGLPPLEDLAPDDLSKGGTELDTTDPKHMEALSGTLPSLTEPAPKHPLVQLQEALKSGQEPELERYFNQLHEEVRSAGVQDRQLQLGYKEDYLPQMWANPPDEVASAFKDTRRLGTKPSFSMESVFKDYQEGIDKGLTPKFEKPSDMISDYARYVDKFVADKNFFDQLKTNGLLKTREQLGTNWKDWEALDPKRTPVQRFTTVSEKGNNTTNNITREYYVPKDIASSINEYLQGKDSDSVLNKISKGFGQVKSLVMTSGIPGTALNIHGVNIGVGRMWASGGADMVGHYLRMALDPQHATDLTQANLHDAPRFVRAGLKFNPEFTARSISPDTSIVDKALTVKHNVLERPLFGQVIPQLQLELAQMAEKGYLKRGVEQNLATKLAAHDANNFVSNLNTDELMRRKDVSSLASAISFAPQWLESHLNLAKGAASALLNPKDPKGYMYRQATSQVLKAYLTVGLINKATTGTFDPFELHLGKDSKGKDVTLPLMGSGDDWLKMPIQIAQAAFAGKPFDKLSDLTKGRLASPLQFATDFLAKQKAQGGDLLRDRKGPLPVVVPEKGRNSQVENVSELGARTLLPRWIPDTIDYARGKTSLENVGADLVGSQARFRNTPKVKRPF